MPRGPAGPDRSTTAGPPGENHRAASGRIGGFLQHADQLELLPDLAISSDGPVRSVLLFSRRPPSALGGARVLVSSSSRTSVLLLEELARRAPGALDVIIERDGRFPPFAALLAQMEARRQAETEPDAAFATQEAPAEEIESPEESASFGMAEGTEEPADPAAEIESATLQTGSEVEAFLPAPAQEEPEEAVVEAEEALAEALATQAAGAMAPEQDDATQEGRIQGAVEKVFERFRPLLVEAIAKELRRRD